MKLGLTLICVIVLLSGLSFYLYDRNRTISQDNDRLKLNEKVYNNGIIYYKTKLNNQAAVTGELQRKIGEFENDKTNSQLLSKIKELNIKLKNVESATVVTQKIDTVIKDSIQVIRDCMELNNQFIYVKLCPDSAKINIKDSLYIIEDNSKKVYINPPSKFFLFRWFQKKQRVITVSVIHSNKLIQTNDVKKQIIIK